jgi:hypothetical protein
VFQISAYCTGGTYSLRMSEFDVPYWIYIPLVLKPMSPTGTDPYEPNNTMWTAYVFPVATSASALYANFVPSCTDQDWFAFYVKTGRLYRASTSNLVGVDTYLEIFDEDGNRVIADDDGGGWFASRAEWQAAYIGYYYIKVTNLACFSTAWDTYHLTVAQINTD